MSSIISGIKILCRRKEVYISPLTSLAVGLQFRFKGNKSEHRFKAPSTPKDKERKFVGKKKKHDDAVIIDYEISKTPSTDDVWNRKYFPTPVNLFLEAIERHREYASPQMTDNPDSVVLLEAELDLTTKKKTKFVGLPSGIILLPHNFDNFFPDRVVAITKTEEDQKKAELAGAMFTGGQDLIRKLERGEIRGEDYDHVVLNTDMMIEAAVIKKVLKDLFPSKKNANLGTDVERMVKVFVHGKEYQAIKISDAVGKFTFPIGKLNMTNEQLVENIKEVLATIKEQKQGSAGPNFFAKFLILCPPSKEVFVVKDESILPPVAIETKKSKSEEDEEEIKVAAADNL